MAEAQPDSSAAAAVAAAAAADLGLTAASAEAGSAAHHVRNSFADQVSAGEGGCVRCLLLGLGLSGGGGSGQGMLTPREWACAG